MVYHHKMSLYARIQQFPSNFFLCKIDINCAIFELTASFKIIVGYKLQKTRKEYINHRLTKPLPFYIVNQSLDTIVTDITPACVNRL